MATESVLDEKYLATFNNFDANGSGVVDQTDLDALVQRVGDQLGYGPDSSQYQEFQRACARVWQRLLKALGKEEGQDFSREEYVNLLRDLPNKEIRTIFAPYASGMFALADGDGDGMISKDEFEKHQRAWQLSEDQISGTFERLDTDGDGALSEAEYVDFVHEFFESSDPNAPANVLSGD